MTDNEHTAQAIENIEAAVEDMENVSAERHKAIRDALDRIERQLEDMRNTARQ